MQTLNFPKGFLWGSATSSHQIEGDNFNDWSEWEKSDSRIQELQSKNKNLNEYVSGKACDSYNRYEEDFNIAKQLGHNIHRFSIEWSRIEPEEGRFNKEAIEHYKNIIKALKDRGIKPMVTLWHFTNPIWFAELGGFLNKKSTEYFTRYVKYVVENLRDEVDLWITFNEGTTVYSGMSYLKGYWPPQKKYFRNMLTVNRNIVSAHISAYKAIKNIYSRSPASEDKNADPEIREDSHASHNIGRVSIGVTENNSWIVVPWYLKIIGVGKIVSYIRNHYLLSRAHGYYDFIGLNYYNILRLSGSYSVLPQQAMAEEMGWEIYPEGIFKVLVQLKNKYNRPIYITENGIADGKDLKREKFIKDHLYWVWRAIKDGVDVRGYMYWSLLDNFEWAHGYGPRFGLIEVDYVNNQKRTIRSSAFEYAKICLANQLDIDVD